MGNRKLTDSTIRLTAIGDSIATTKASLVILEQKRDKAVGVVAKSSRAGITQDELSIGRAHSYPPRTARNDQ